MVIYSVEYVIIASFPTSTIDITTSIGAANVSLKVIIFSMGSADGFFSSLFSSTIGISPP